MSIRKLMTKVNLESEAEETVGATEEDILDVIESDEITADLVEASKEANEAAEADQELTDLAEEVTETIGDIEEKLEDTAEVEPEPVTAIPIPRIGNTIAVYDTVPNTGTSTYSYEVSDIISERGKQVADKYGAEEVFKAYDMLDSKSSSVMKDIDKVLTGTTALRNRVGESKTLDADVAKFLRRLMLMSQDMLKFYLDYQKYLVTTVNLINQNTVNK